MKWQIQQDAQGLARIAHVSEQCLFENCLQIIEKEKGVPNNCPDLNTMEISCLGSKARSYFVTFIYSPKQFLN